MKLAFMYDKDGNFNCNTSGVKYRRYTGKQPAVCIEVPSEDKGGSYKIKGVPYPLVHYYAEDIDVWILNPGGDIPTPKEVVWENWEELL